ncbi:hypothetical protein DSECCO2_404870 [anaerobic digester metagenome]
MQFCALVMAGYCLVSPTPGSTGSDPPEASVTMSMETTTPLDLATPDIQRLPLDNWSF